MNEYASQSNQKYFRSLVLIDSHCSAKRSPSQKSSHKWKIPLFQSESPLPLIQECPPPPPPPEPSPPSGIMPVDALDALAAAFADSAPSGRVPLDSAAEIVPRVARECLEARSNPANQPVTPRLPGRQKAAAPAGENMWADVSEETFQVCTSYHRLYVSVAFDPSSTCFATIKHVLISENPHSSTRWHRDSSRFLGADMKNAIDFSPP